MLLHASATGSKLGAHGGIFSPMPAFNFTRASEAMNTVRLAQGGILEARTDSTPTNTVGDLGIYTAESLGLLRIIADRLSGVERGVARLPKKLEIGLGDVERKQAMRDKLIDTVTARRM
jgi:hypothetical protein